MSQLPFFTRTKSANEIIQGLEEGTRNSLEILQRLNGSLVECTERLNRNSTKLEKGGLSERDQTRIKAVNEKFRNTIAMLNIKIMQLLENIELNDKRIAELRAIIKIEQASQAISKDVVDTFNYAASA